jgi:hypothetical protein
MHDRQNRAVAGCEDHAAAYETVEPERQVGHEAVWSVAPPRGQPTAVFAVRPKLFRVAPQANACAIARPAEGNHSLRLCGLARFVDQDEAKPR